MGKFKGNSEYGSINTKDDDHEEMEAPMSTFHPSQPAFRYLILAVTCLFSLGSYYSFDQPSTLQSLIQAELNLDPVQYNMLYSLYSWANFGMVMFSGIITDKIGSSNACYLFSGIILVGQTVFAVGAMTRQLTLMFVGRFFFGMGGGSIVVVQNTISSKYFTGHELALAFGITLTASRLGSAMNFLVTPFIADAYGLIVSLFFGAVLCLVSVLSAFAFTALDNHATKVLGNAEKQKSVRRINFDRVLHFPLSFWIVSLLCSSFYCTIFPFIADSSKFFEKYYNLDNIVASRVSGIGYDLSILLSPVLGRAVDVYGQRANLCILFSILIIPVHLAYATLIPIHPAFPMVLLGIAYSLAASCVWSILPLVIKQTEIGTAYGVMTMVQMLGIALSNIAVGDLVQNTPLSYVAAMWFFVGCGGVSLLLSLWLVGDNKRHDNILNWNAEQFRLLKEQQEKEHDTEDSKVTEKTRLKI